MHSSDEHVPEDVARAREAYRRQRAIATWISVAVVGAIVLVSFVPGFGDPMSVQIFLFALGVALVIAVPSAWLVAILVTADRPPLWHRLSVTALGVVALLAVTWIAFAVLVLRQYPDF